MFLSAVISKLGLQQVTITHTHLQMWALLVNQSKKQYMSLYSHYKLFSLESTYYLQAEMKIKKKPKHTAIYFNFSYKITLNEPINDFVY